MFFLFFVGLGCIPLGPPMPSSPLRVWITHPKANATVSGEITLSAAAQGPTEVSGIQFTIDHQNIGPTLTEPPFEVVVDTRQLSEGVHAIRAIGMDRLGNTAFNEVIVHVRNRRSNGQ